MKTKDFELQLKEIDENINIRPSAVSDMEGIYYKDIYICGIPSNNIYEETKSDYKNELGTPHKTTLVAIQQVNQWLEEKEDNLELEKEFNELTKKENEKPINTGNTEEIINNENKEVVEEVKS